MTSIYYKEFWLVIIFILLSIFLLESRRSAKLYGTILGRLLLVVIIIMASIYDFTFGILIVTIITIGFKSYYSRVEYGIEPFSNKFEKKDKDKKDVGIELANNDGPLDYTHLEQNIRPKESGSIEPQLNSSSEEVEPTSVENFQSEHSFYEEL